jgi:hypothetical protein
MLAGGLRYNLDSQKVKMSIKAGESRERRASIEASIKASEERASKPLERPRREGIGKQLEELRKLRKSLGVTSHL